MTAPKPMAADQDAAGSMVSTLANLNADKVVEDKATDLKPYGLDMPTLDVQIVRKDGKTDHLLIGDDTPTGSGAYAKLANDAKVVTVATSIKTSLDKRPDDLRDKRLLTFDSDKLSRVELAAKGPAVEFGKNGQNEWQIVKPRPLRADGSAVDGLVSKLKDAKMDLTDDGRRQEVRRGGQGGHRHRHRCRRHADPRSPPRQGQERLRQEFRGGRHLQDRRRSRRRPRQRAWTISATRSSSISASATPARSTSRASATPRAATSGLPDGKTMDNASVQTLIDKLRDLAATKFAEKGGGQPVFEATVISNTGKRSRKSGRFPSRETQYFAQREGEPSIYELDAKAVEDLQKAAADVKEAAPEPAKKK